VSSAALSAQAAQTASVVPVKPEALEAPAAMSFFQIGQEEEVETRSKEDDDDNDDQANVEDDSAAAVDEAPAPPDDGSAWTATSELQTTESSVTNIWSKYIWQVVLLIVVLTLVVNTMLRYSSPRNALSMKMRKKLESMYVATGPEIRSVCATDGAATPDKLLSGAGVLMRIQGRVVSKSAGPLIAPLSGRSCVLYSASVSQHRHDGVHQPPVAFDSASQDFSVQLEDCPEMLLEISSQDVLPFDMEAGRYASELAFGDAPDTWRSFMLANLTPGVEGAGAKGQSMNRVDLGAKGPLNFRECGLVVGSRVTCIGEVVREHNGKLRLCPWSPPVDAESIDTAKSKGRSWLNTEPDPWVHKLMISDDSRLFSEASQKNRSCT